MRAGLSAPDLLTTWATIRRCAASIWVSTSIWSGKAADGRYRPGKAPKNMYRCVGVLAMVLPALLAADPVYQSAETKLDHLEKQDLKPGEVVEFTPQEIDA